MLTDTGEINDPDGDRSGDVLRCALAVATDSGGLVEMRKAPAGIEPGLFRH